MVSYDHLRQLFKIRPGEERLVVLITGAMFIASMGGSIGSPGVEALFFTRFGVEYLPYMYVALGIFTIGTSLAVTVILGRIPHIKFYLFTPVVLALLLLFARIFLNFNYLWFYPVLWLGMRITWTLQALFTWGTAGTVCDTRQAKRLFPLFGAGGILGVSVGGLVTAPLSRYLTPENLLLFWIAGMSIAALLGWRLLNQDPTFDTAADPSRRSESRDSFRAEMRQGYDTVRRTELFKWLSVVAILFSVLLYSLAFPFSTAASLNFPDANELSGFLGVFWGVSTGVAFLASIFIANRLYARFGITSMLLAYTAIYFVGFVVLSVAGTFTNLVGFHFIQIFWYQGIAISAYQAIFNIVPLERRDQARAFIDGVPAQFGVILAGIILLLSERVLVPQQLFLLASGIALLAGYFAWRASRVYRYALLDALRAGQPHLFFGGEEPFGGFLRDATAMEEVVKGIAHPDPVIRRVSAEILGTIPMPEVQDALVQALDDEDPHVRAALLRSLALSGATAAILEVLRFLQDPAPTVRREALQALRDLAGYGRGLAAQIRPLLQDPDISVRASAAGLLLNIGDVDASREELQAMLTSPDREERLDAYREIGHWRENDAIVLELLQRGLGDPSKQVRRAAALALSKQADPGTVEDLISLLGDEDSSVRGAAAHGLGEIGQPALAATIDALNNPELADGALLALAYFSLGDFKDRIRKYVRGEVDCAGYYYRLESQIPQADGDVSLSLLRESVGQKTRTSATNALRALGLVGDRVAISLALSNLDSGDSNQRANAIETLETINEVELVRSLLPIWETQAVEARSNEDFKYDGWLETLLQDPDAWIRACAVLFAGGVDNPLIRERLVQLADSDQDKVVREAAASAVKGSTNMETLQTLSVMERILFLRHVPLFQDLPPEDLKQVASIVREALYTNGDIITRQDDRGEEMFIIVKGEVSVQVFADRGTLLEVARRGPGEYVGEMAIISHEPRMASLIAIGDVRLIKIGQKEFEGILRERPETSLALMRVLCDRLREQTQN